MTLPDEPSFSSAVEYLTSILSIYRMVELDTLSSSEITSAIQSLEDFIMRHGHIERYSILIQPISDIISRLYVARGYASLDVPRSLEYYKNLNEVRRYIEQIAHLA